MGKEGSFGREMSLSATQQVLIAQMVRPLIEAIDSAVHRYSEFGKG